MFRHIKRGIDDGTCHKPKHVADLLTSDEHTRIWRVKLVIQISFYALPRNVVLLKPKSSSTHNYPFPTSIQYELLIGG